MAAGVARPIAYHRWKATLTKPSPGLVEEFKAAIEPIRDGQPRKMFGYDCVFVNGTSRRDCGGTPPSSGCRPRTARITAEAGAIPFAPMKGRTMKGWYESPEAVSHDAEQLTEWCARAAAFARSLPPKAPKGPRRAERPLHQPLVASLARRRRRSWDSFPGRRERRS
jgi:hypothetical protein